MKKKKPEKLEKDELEEPRNQLDELQKEKDDLFEKLQRVSADYVNFQKRASKQISDAIIYEKEKIIKTLLPALDNFEHTLQRVHSAGDIDTLVKGVRIIYDQMLDILKSHGVEQIQATGEKFDPALHEAMMQQAEPEQEDNVVLEEFQKGYKLNGRVIRPSKVIVNKLISEAKAQKIEINETEEVEQEPQEQKTSIQEQATDEAESEMEQ